MKTIQISTIGGQPLPVIQGIIEFNCHLNILFHSKETFTMANKIQKAASTESVLQLAYQVHDFFSLCEQIQHIADEYTDCQWFVNISGGTKMMSLALYSVFTSKYQGIVYHIDQNGFIHFLHENKTHPLTSFLSIENHIAYSGQTIRNYDPHCEETYYCTNGVETIEMLYTTKNQYKNLLKAYRNTIQDSNGSLTESFEININRPHSVLSWNKEFKEVKISFYHGLLAPPEIYVFTGNLFYPLIFNTQWFEYKVAEILSRWTKTKELVSNLIIEYADGLAKNEIDMVVNTGSKLVFVECKTAVFDIKDIDKFHNVAKLCGGLGAKAILITFHKPNARILEKCADNHMLTFWFHDAKQSKSEDILYKILDDEIHKSNPV